ncbi:MAG: hypothetical protein KGM42_20575 [Hyphomicrobiales bacterium]|nr:hypothetical protein [Hyphomicrobiales bacterium]
MRKEPKHFTVEVKRRPGVAAKKPAPFLPAPAEPAPQPAASLFRTPSAAQPATTVAERRILPCLVTEAQIDAAQAEALSEAEPVQRARGRPRKAVSPDAPAPLAPRKRGRPRKTPAPAPHPVEHAAPMIETPVAPPPLVLSERRASRLAGELPRGERWKRRLPKALR